MRATTLCPGYFERYVQEMIEANGTVPTIAPSADNG